MRRYLSSIAIFTLLAASACPAEPPNAEDVTNLDAGTVGAGAGDVACGQLDTGGPDVLPPLPAGPHLTRNEAWTLMPQDLDPWWPSRAPEKVPCSTGDLAVEDLAPPDTSMSVNTANCGYATLSQPLLHDVDACSSLLIHIFYWSFKAPKVVAGVAYEIVVTIGDDIDDPLLRVSSDTLPETSGLIYEVVQAKRAYKAGEQVYFHVSNHGANAWEFIQLRLP